MANLLPTNPVEIIAKLHHINQNHQDSFYNLLAFSLQTSSLIIKSSTNVNNATSIGLSNLGQSINSSRFILRFLSGISSIHILIQNHTVLRDFFRNFITRIKKLFTVKKQTRTEAVIDAVTGTDEDALTKSLSDDIIPVLRLFQAVLTLGHNVSEIPAYISTVAPMLVPMLSKSYNGDAFGRLSCFFWFLNTLVEVLIVSIMRYRKEISSGQYQYSLIPLACDVLLSANWSLQSKSQFLSEAGLTTLGLTSACVNFAAIWKSIKTD